jgi:hypothetical protein
MYQLVLQLPTDSVDYDELVAIEEELLAAVKAPAVVDGHDFGSGEGNIFILTDTPSETLESVLPVLRSRSCERDATLAYRTLGGNLFTVIWPKGFKGEFSVA